MAIRMCLLNKLERTLYAFMFFLLSNNTEWSWMKDIAKRFLVISALQQLDTILIV